MNEHDVDDYLRDGCGRCDHYRLPTCKVHRWASELRALRALALECGLEESVKWGVPCYGLGDKNVVLVAAFRDHCALSFLAGAALDDPDALLELPGPSSRHARFVKFRSMSEVDAKRLGARRLLEQAIQRARSGEKFVPAPASEPMPPELGERLAADPALARAFEALTPGRRRSYVLHVSGAKGSATRERRVDRCVPLILAGRGFGER